MRAGSSNTVSRRRSGSHNSYSVANKAPTSGAPSASTKRTWVAPASRIGAENST